MIERTGSGTRRRDTNKRSGSQGSMGTKKRKAVDDGEEEDDEDDEDDSYREGK